MAVTIYEGAYDLPHFLTGLSGDTKPAVDANGATLHDRSIFYETDTQAYWFFMNGAWYPHPQSSLLEV